MVATKKILPEDNDLDIDDAKATEAETKKRARAKKDSPKKLKEIEESKSKLPRLMDPSQIKKEGLVKDDIDDCVRDIVNKVKNELDSGKPGDDVKMNIKKELKDEDENSSQEPDKSKIEETIPMTEKKEQPICYDWVILFSLCVINIYLLSAI